MRAVLGDVAQDVVERDADAGEFMRQVEDFAELPVPADQRQLLVEHGDALAHMIERGLQDFAIVVDRRVGIVEQFQRRLGRDGALAQQQRQHQPRRSGADGRGQQIFAVLQELEVGFGLRLEADAARGGEALKRFARALVAEIARDGGDQFLDGDRGAAQPESSAPSARARRHEHVGLHAFDRGRPARQREADIDRRCWRQG